MDEKLPFQTREEIERRSLRGGGLKTAQVKELLEALYLRAHETDRYLRRISSLWCPTVSSMMRRSTGPAREFVRLARPGCGEDDLPRLNMYN
jgi:hypothetical protein